MFVLRRRKLALLAMVVLTMASLAAGQDRGTVAFDPFGTNEANVVPLPDDGRDTSPVVPEIQFNNDDISTAFQIISDYTGWSIFPTAGVTYNGIGPRS